MNLVQRFLWGAEEEHTIPMKEKPHALLAQQVTSVLRTPQTLILILVQPAIIAPMALNTLHSILAAKAISMVLQRV